MTLIKCPQCNQDISDKADKCVNCGYELKKTISKNFCLECGEEILEGETICSKCGCPVEIIEENNIPVQQVFIQEPPKKKNKLKIFIIILIVLLVLGGGAFAAYTIIKNNEEKAQEEADRLIYDYYSNMYDVVDKMLDGAVLAEECGNLTYEVWYNTIWEEKDSKTDKYTKKNGKFHKDFNDALKALYNDADFSEKITKIKNNQNEVNTLMNKLNDPPTKYANAYSDLKLMYSEYQTLTNLAINPTGTLITFGNNFNTAKTNFLNEYNKMKTHLGI